MYRRLNVYTAYEFLGQRFDAKTRLLGAGLFLLQRGLAAGITIYAPAIILSTVLGWRLDLTIVLTGLLVIVYTVAGGSEAVSLTQKYQMAVIFGGMVAAFVVLLLRLPDGLGFAGAAHVAGGFGKLQAVDFSLDPSRRYTFWSGLLGGFFLSLSYFGTDQSQVQRYIGGAVAAREPAGPDVQRRVQDPDAVLHPAAGRRWCSSSTSSSRRRCSSTRRRGAAARQDSRRAAARPRAAVRRRACAQKQATDPGLARRPPRRRPRAARRKPATAMAAAGASHAARPCAPRRRPRSRPPTRAAKTKDTDYVFITFILRHLPHGVIGLLVAVFFAAALSSKAAELNALAPTTTIDF